jgi:hypothetical protein
VREKVVSPTAVDFLRSNKKEDEMRKLLHRLSLMVLKAGTALAVAGLAAAPHAFAKDQNLEEADLGFGCAPNRPAIAHRAGGVLADADKDERVPIPCVSRTEFRTGEISIVVTKNGTAVFQPAVETAAGSPVGVLRSVDQGANWEFSVPSPPRTISVDQRMSLDQQTGRIFWIQLGLPADTGITLSPRLDISDDGGKTWFTGGVTLGFDDPSIFTGPPPKSLGPLTQGYPNVVYACMGHQPLKCERSLDGGLTWGVEVDIPFPPELEPLQIPPVGCGEFGTKGVVGQDGTVYVPFTPCNRPYVAISHDEGETWRLVRVADTETIGFGALPVDMDKQGNLYAAWVKASDRLPYMAVSRDDGLHWSEPLMIGAPGVNEAAIPALVAGERGQVAVTYYGSDNAPLPFPPACETPSLNCPGYDKETWNTYITETWNGLDRTPLFWSASLNDPAQPTWYGVTPSAVGVIRVDELFNRGPGYTQGGTTGDGAHPSGPGGRIDYFGAVMAPDDTAWVGFAQECPFGHPVSGNPSCPNTLTGTGSDGLFGLVGRLVRRVEPDS